MDCSGCGDYGASAGGRQTAVVLVGVIMVGGWGCCEKSRQICKTGAKRAELL
ncbi:MAG TPA: hypothetical protein GXX17_01185 [Clostridiales bacterium]|nr:hypothetical protein [Clostridiales bacterium]